MYCCYCVDTESIRYISKTCIQNGNQINLEAGGAWEKIILFIINMLEMLFFFVGIGIVWYTHSRAFLHFCKQLSYDLFYMSHCDARQSVVTRTHETQKFTFVDFQLCPSLSRKSALSTCVDRFYPVVKPLPLTSSIIFMLSTKLRRNHVTKKTAFVTSTTTHNNKNSSELSAKSVYDFIECLLFEWRDDSVIQI